MNRVYVGNYCTRCKKNLPSENFGKKWSKYRNEYLLINICKKCHANLETKRRKTESWASNYQKYIAEGYYGWTTEWENNLMRYYWQFIKAPNIWEKKFIRTYTFHNYFDKRSGNSKSYNEKKEENLKNTERFMSKRKFRMNKYNILHQMMINQCMSAYEAENSKLRSTQWEKEIIELKKHLDRR